MADDKNIMAENISIDDTAAVMHFIILEMFAALTPKHQFSDRLTDFTNRLLEASDQMTVPKRRALLKAIAIYLTATEEF